MTLNQLILEKYLGRRKILKIYFEFPLPATMLPMIRRMDMLDVLYGSTHETVAAVMVNPDI